MSGRHEKDRANTKPGDLRAETAKRVGLTAHNQNILRREGFSSYHRGIRAIVREYGPDFPVGKALPLMCGEAERRWGPDWEVDG